MCWLGLVGPVQLQDVMGICAVAVKCMDQAAIYVMAVKCMDQAATYVIAVQLQGVTPGSLFQHSGTSIRGFMPRDETVLSSCVAYPAHRPSPPAHKLVL